MKNRRMRKQRPPTFTEVRRRNEERLNEIAGLTGNWDGEGAAPMADAALDAAWKVLDWLARMSGPVMRVYPTRDAGVSLETDDLEMVVTRAGRFEGVVYRTMAEIVTDYPHPAATWIVRQHEDSITHRRQNRHRKEST